MNLLRRHGQDGERAQVLMITALLLTALLGLLALAIDAGLGYSYRSQSQSAADNAALAAAEAMAKTGVRTQAVAAALEYAQRNGFVDGVKGAAVTVNNPPASGPHTGDDRFFEVKISQPSPNIFLKVLKAGSTNVGARAVAGINPGNVLPYNFTSLRDDCQKHTLKVDLGGALTVKGGIYVNSGNADNPLPQGTTPVCSSYESKGGPGYGDGFDVFGTGGSISAQQIKVVGGWETHNNDLVCLPGGCCQPPGPCAPAASPLIGQPALPDPLLSLAAPKLSDHPVRNGSAGAPAPLIISSGTATLQPGAYYGGIQLSGTASVTLAPGVYIMAGGGMSATGGASLNAGGAMIYNTRASATPPPGGGFSAINIATTGSVTLQAPRVGPYAGMLIFQDRAATTNIVLGPGNGISGLSGTVYAPGWKPNSKADLKCSSGAPKKGDEDGGGTPTTDSGAATVVINASGTANLQVISAQILICGANATFQFDASGFANAGLSLVE